MSDEIPTNGNQDHLEASKAHARAAASEMRDAAAEAARELRERAGSVAGEWQGKARDIQNELEDYVRKNPAKSILAAAGLGFVIGLICRR
jgi:ElaB/YqjD/DUF883 family membrane-anchored ribosome-binding protein